ncbi:MAG TPA: MraY family glycosyltransferase [Acidobacteriota bacterium]|nr:MraY family glycosyltransferase [Acidobacteriota bacterium]
MADLGVIIGVATFSWLVTVLLVPLIARLCRQRGWLDQPGPRKVHTRPTPRLTGVALFVAIWLPLVGLTLLFPHWLAEFRGQALPILSGAIVILLLGIVDDLRPLPGSAKLGVQLIVGSFLWFAGVNFGRLWIPFVGGLELGALSWPVTVLWFLILVNAVNIIDGLDGLAVGTTAVAALTLLWVSQTLALRPIWIGTAGLFGGLVAFWRYNRHPAQVFMGDGGSLSLGYFFAVVALMAPIKRFTAVAFFVPIFALILPLAESAFSVWRRSLTGTNPLRADYGHLHHRLLAAGWSPKAIVRAYMLVTGVFGLFSVLMRYGNRRLVALGIGIFVLLIMVVLGIIFDLWGKRAGSRRAAGKRFEE